MPWSTPEPSGWRERWAQSLAKGAVFATLGAAVLWRLSDRVRKGAK